MELSYETSLSAYILLQEVEKELNIRETPEESRRNGNFKKILMRCNKVIEKRYVNEEQQIKLKTYIENIFFQD
ncbi:MAG: hypothetical protein IPH62_08760 [Ignavibacteriae bacterium]|nr:hypothetical protein [Ignavibacteriota bacterium]